MTQTIYYQDRPTFFPGTPAWLPGTLESLAGDRSYAIRKDNGKLLSVNPLGDYEEATAVGPYETFTLDPNTSVVHVLPRIVTFTIAVKER